MMLDEINNRLTDLAVKLVAQAGHLSGQLPEASRQSVGELVGRVNVFYISQIEGWNLRPQEVDNALAGLYSEDSTIRVMQHQVRAFVEVQQTIDSHADPKFPPSSSKYVRWLHNELYRRLPSDIVSHARSTTERQLLVSPGEFRVGDATTRVEGISHLAPASRELPKLMKQFELTYGSRTLSLVQAVVALAAAHLFLVWLLPFNRCNQRVAMLMTHANFLRLGIDSRLWPISRGLARNAAGLRSFMSTDTDANAYQPESVAVPSGKRLSRFCGFFLGVCVEQIEFLQAQLTPSELLRRMKLYCDDEIAAKRLPNRSMALLREAVLVGEFSRGRAPEITGYQERQGRQALAELLKRGFLVSEGPKSPVRLGFPVEAIERWIPALCSTG